jgi:glycosyltransferase involved in cell wall biosynthesis
VHNHYQQSGGEDTVVAQEVALLRRKGHTVIEYYRTNHEIDHLSVRGKISLPKRMIWADDAAQDLGELIRQQKPDIAHFHNTFIMISPSAYYTCQKAGLPVIQTLHNYRLLCPVATFFRDGHICEDCLHKAVPWPAIVHACYHQSVIQTGAVAAMLAVHRWLKTWQKQVDCYITPTDFVRRKFIEGGISPEKLRVKPHFVHPDPGPKEGPEHYFLFVGRLSSEKGVKVLLQAWKRLKNVPLKIVGDGPLMTEMQQTLKHENMDKVELLGQQSMAKVISLMREALWLVMPSESYETFGQVAVESFACGTPVIASQRGAMAELIENGRTGLHFIPGDPDDLTAKVKWALNQPSAAETMGKEARREYEANYTAEANYDQLIGIYQQTIKAKRNVF